jgi:tRNA uridine 5-carboxymethylaminomethyl modification enzyme
MFTSRAEHRLHLRSDNADERLTPIGRNLGLVDDARELAFMNRAAAIENATQCVLVARVDGLPAAEVLRRPDRTWADVAAGDPALSAISAAVGRQVEIRAKYQGYITRQSRQIDQLAKMESRLIPRSIDYLRVPGLRNEARQKLTQFTPRSLGQALRISGITPADITLVAIHLTRAAAAR